MVMLGGRVVRVVVRVGEWRVRVRVKVRVVRRGL